MKRLNVTDGLGNLRDAVRNARLSVLEMVALVAALAFVGVIVFFYFNKVQPLNTELEALKEKETQLQLRLGKFKTDEEKRQQQAANADSILGSLRTFEAYLKPDERGMTQIINEIDQLGKTHNVLIGDASYRVEEPEPPLDENGQVKQAAQNEKKQKIYPSLGIDTVVIGEYLGLRRFLADLERSKQFLVINAVNFQGESDQVRRAANKTGGRKLQLSSSEAVPVTLKIELDTYFQPPARATETASLKTTEKSQTAVPPAAAKK